MIVREHFRTREDGIELYITYSDSDKMILQNETGVLYDKAIDVENSAYTYTETDNDIQNTNFEYENEIFEKTE